MPRLTAVLSLLFVASLSAVGCQAAERATMAPEDGLVAIVNASTTSDRLYEGQFCGGAAIAATQVVTAAHCVSGRRVETLAVAAGGLDVWKALTSTEGVFCARPTGEENTCAGDSGGPLYQEVGPRAVVVGLVEGGIGCEAMDDGVYTHLGGIALRFPQR